MNMKPKAPLEEMEELFVEWSEFVCFAFAALFITLGVGAIAGLVLLLLVALCP
jgi:hypothetical protein